MDLTPPTLAQRLDWLVGSWRLERDRAAAMRREVRAELDGETTLELVLGCIDVAILGLAQIRNRAEARQ